MAFLKTGDGGNGGSTPSFDHYEYDITALAVTNPWGTLYNATYRASFGKTYNQIDAVNAYFTTSDDKVAIAVPNTPQLTHVDVFLNRATTSNINGKLCVDVYGN